MIESVLVDSLAQYGLLGVMMLLLVMAVKYLARRDEIRDEKITKVVENNTVVITKFIEMSKKCEVRK